MNNHVLRRFESCWPAIMKGVDGVILVYNPEIPTHDMEVGIWWVNTCKPQKLFPVTRLYDA